MPNQTLTQRLAALRAAFQAEPHRRPFTRSSANAVVGTSTQVSLPRGTKDLHLFVVLGVSAGGVESTWPVASDPLCGRRFVAFAAPQTVAPGPPALEVSLAGDGAERRLRRQGPRQVGRRRARVSRVDLHRVRVPDAAVSVDMMGPPVATIAGTGGGFTVVATPPGDPDSRSDDGVAQPIGTITGIDTVTGSWKPVFYRAVAWGTDDADRGQYGVRSQASVVRQVVVPPSAPPDLEHARLRAAGRRFGERAHRLARPRHRWSRPRSDHTCSRPRWWRPTRPGCPPRSALGVSQAPLDALAITEPGAGLSGLWRDPTVGGVTPLHLLVRRADPETTLRVRVRLTDPLGRLTERTLDVPEVPPVQPPDLFDPTLTTVAGGTILSFSTSVPNEAPGFGPFRVQVTFRPSTGRVARRGENLADIVVARRNEDLFAVADRDDPDPADAPRARHHLDRRRTAARGDGHRGRGRGRRHGRQHQSQDRKGGEVPVSEIASFSVLTAADAANQLQSRGLDALGLTVPGFGTQWSTASTTVDDPTLHLSVTGPRAPFTGTFRFELEPVTLAELSGDPITSPCGVLTMHPEAVHRLETLVRQRYGVLQRPVPVDDGGARSDGSRR